MMKKYMQQQWQEHDQTVIQCKKCPRLVQWREEIAREKRRAFISEDYWGKPVPAFGDHNARVIVIGLAPGAHGSNRTGRMFTGDASGDFLYPALFRAGFASQAFSSNKKDGLILADILITSVCRCVPPGNKPSREEIQNCLPFLMEEIKMINPNGFVALGKVAFKNILNVLQKGDGLVYNKNIVFTHGALYEFGANIPWLLVSYHPSRQNTQTRKLSKDRFDYIWRVVLQKLKNS